jgi:hypothetical protein
MARSRAVGYPVVRVFVSFDTEKSQRSCLRDLWVGGLEDAMERTGVHSSVRGVVRRVSMGGALKEQKAQFREDAHTASQKKAVQTKHAVMGRSDDYHHLLFLGEEDGMINVQEAADPGNIVWEHLGLVSWSTALSQQLYVLFVIAATVLFTFELVHETQKFNGPLVTGVVIVLINCVTRPAMRHLCHRLERHESWDAKEFSTFWKLSLSACLNSAFVIWWLTPHEEVLSSPRMELILWYCDTPYTIHPTPYPPQPALIIPSSYALLILHLLVSGTASSTLSSRLCSRTSSPCSS